MTPECNHCGAPVSQSYVRVFAPERLENEGKVRACPNCTRVREHGGIRKARSRGDAGVRGDVA